MRRLDAWKEEQKCIFSDTVYSSYEAYHTLKQTFYRGSGIYYLSFHCLLTSLSFHSKHSVVDYLNGFIPANTLLGFFAFKLVFMGFIIAYKALGRINHENDFYCLLEALLSSSETVRLRGVCQTQLCFFSQERRKVLITLDVWHNWYVKPSFSSSWNFYWLRNYGAAPLRDKWYFVVWALWPVPVLYEASSHHC